jgi:serine phosphatase RsbU (regulator of sigma subunit)
MSLFQVLTRIASLSSPPRKRRKRLNSTWSTIIRVHRSIVIIVLLFILILDILHSNYVFILLPVFLSLITVGSRRYDLSLFLTSTPLYLFATLCLAFVYYGFITLFESITHQASTMDHIVLITTTLAWTVLSEPLHLFVQGLIEQRFNVRNREARKAITAFTSTLREEIDLDLLGERFLTVVQQTLRPYTVSLWRQGSGKEDENSPEIQLVDGDPLLASLLKHPEAVELARLRLTSPLLSSLALEGVELILPLVNQGTLSGLLTLGIKIDGKEYSRDERTLLNTLAAQVAPALRVAQMVYEQREQIRERERIEQELRTAAAIQQAFLPKSVPALPGWHLVPYYQPAREVGGDFYDFLLFADGRVGLVIGDVTGKGVPAALVMTTVHTMLRTTSQSLTSPAEILARVNDLLTAEIPAGMFVTCFYALLDPRNGKLCFANAGHEAPYRQSGHEAAELWASGMPLGMMPGTSYEEYEATLAPGESLLFYSDGLVEAHNPGKEMFGFPRLQSLLTLHDREASLISFLLSELQEFTGDVWEQEDDVTLLTLHRIAD